MDNDQLIKIIQIPLISKDFYTNHCFISFATILEMTVDLIFSE